ncbi:MAG: hypothetical protein K0U66_06545, partial [Gammaproteobacteria bacterium]|nr:hypothetical protein [Gammaproteobacteria bacterium]
ATQNGAPIHASTRRLGKHHLMGPRSTPPPGVSASITQWGPDPHILSASQQSPTPLSEPRTLPPLQQAITTCVQSTHPSGALGCRLAARPPWQLFVAGTASFV